MISEMEHKGAGIDSSRFFMPETLTPLYYTPIYGRLSRQQKRRYNQLQGLYFNEQFIFFESSLPSTMLAPLLARPEFGPLEESIRAYMTEETRHSEWFRSLNLRCAPEFYGDGPFHFIRLSPVLRWAWEAASRRLDLFPMFIWLIMIQEEKAAHYSREFIEHEDELEPQFVGLQRRHLEDEGGHGQYAMELLNCFWNRATPRTRRVNARLFSWMLREFFTAPRRSGMRVVDAWLREFRELRGLRPDIYRCFMSLDRNPRYVKSHYGPQSIPVTLRRLGEWREFNGLIDYLRACPSNEGVIT